jgi:hypothetical protein
MADTVSTDTGTKVLYVRIDEDFHRELKMSAVARGISLQSLCETILRTHVEQQRESGATAVVTLVTTPLNVRAQGESSAKAVPTT